MLPGCSLAQVEVVEGVAGEEDHHDDQEEQGEEIAEAEGQHDEHDEDGKHRHSALNSTRKWDTNLFNLMRCYLHS